MKKLFLWLCMASLCHTQAQAQTEVPFEVMLDSVLRNVSMAGVSSGLLADRAFPLLPYEACTGSSSDTTHTGFSRWQRLYGTFYQAAISGEYQLPAPDDSYAPLTAHLKPNTSAAIPLAVLHLNYHRFSPTAIADGLIYRQGEQLFDVPNRPASPFLPGTAFAACPALERLDTLAATFVLKPELIFTNTGKTVSYIEADFADGTGYRTLVINTPVAVSWQHGGQIEITIRVHYTDRTEFTGRSYLTLTNAAQLRYAQTDFTQTFSATYGWQTSTGTVHVAYGCGNTALTKPIIIIDGIDYPQLPIDQQNTFARFRAGLNQTTTQNFRQELEQVGYDLVYLDFDNGAEDIRASAQLLKQVINWVNGQKANVPGNEPNIVWGISRGGIVARWALKEMENAGQNHKTSHVIYFDSPHLGSNVPLGLQYMLKDVAHISIGGTRLKNFVPQLQLGLDILDAASTQQLLINQLGPAQPAPFSSTYYYHYDPAEYNAFQQQLNALGGLPQGTAQLPLRSISISNGSRLGQEQTNLQPGSLLFKIEEGYFLDMPSWLQHPVHGIDLQTGAELKFEIHALPTEGVAQRFYLGRAAVKLLGININLHHNEASTGNIGSGFNIVGLGLHPKPYDTAPGGNQSAGAISGNIPAILHQFIYLNPNPVCFMPTLSSQNISHTNPYTPANPNMTSGSSFSRVAAPPYAGVPTVNNEIHTGFTVGNTAILMDELITSRYGATIHAANPLTTIFNYGIASNGNATHNRISTQFNNLHINSGGVLAVNTNTAVAFPNSGWPAPVASSLFTAIVPGGDCATTITVNSGGEFRVGDNNNSLRGNVNFRSGSILRLNHNGTLRIRDNSRVIIEPGATLMVRGTPNIILEGPNAVLEIRGRLDVIDGTFAPATTNTGYVRFALEDLWIPNGNGGFYRASHFSVNPNSVMHLEGNGPQNRVIAEIAEGSWLAPNDWDYGQLILRNGTINMERDAFIQVGNAPLIIQGVHFRGSIVNGQAFKGIDIHGSGNPLITNNRFTGCSNCLTYFGWSGQANNTILITNTVFDQFTTAVQSYNRGTTFRNCNFLGRGLAEGSSVACKVDGAWNQTVLEDCNITGCRAGVTYFGNSGGNLLMRRSTVSGSGTGVQFFGLGVFRGECGSLNSNGLGLQMANGTLDLSSFARYNIVNNNTTSAGYSPNPVANIPRNISFESVRDIYLQEGYNSILSANGSGISGFIQQGASSINAPRNYWRTDNGSPRNHPFYNPWDVALMTMGGGALPFAQHVEILDSSPVPPQYCHVDPCVVPVRDGISLPCWSVARLIKCPDCVVITTDSYPNDSLHLAVIDALTYSTLFNPAGEDDVAIQRLYEILTFPLTDTSAYELSVLNFAFRMLNEIYAHIEGTLHKQQAKNKLLEILQLKLEGVEDSVSLFNPAFYLHLDQALASYTAGSLTEALVQLPEASANLTIANEDLYAYWDCYLSNLKNLEDSVITIYEFYELAGSCVVSDENAKLSKKEAVMDYLMAHLPANQQPKKVQVGKGLSLSPNPAANKVTLNIFSDTEERVEVTLHDMKGMAVNNRNIVASLNNGSTSVELSLAGISQGVYVVKVTGSTTNLSAKLVVSH